MTHIAERAIVIGAGMGGLAAARALSGHFEQVIVLERDALPTRAEPRPGTPQGLHGHGLMTGGLRALCELLPGFDRDLIAAGAVTVRAGRDVRFETAGYVPFPQRDLGWDFHCVSRPVNEFVLRSRVAKLGNVTFRDSCRVDDFVGAPDGDAVSGVRLETADGRTETLFADLTVDASSSGMLTLKLLEQAGLPLPEESRIGVDLGYSTAVFRRPADADPDWKILGVFGDPPKDRRGALVLPMEGDRWMVTLVGRGADRPPGDWEGYMAFAETLPTHTLSIALRQAERIGDPVLYRFTASIRRHFERLTRFPRGLLVFSDAFCRFNPAFGQGMSVAAQEAQLLDRLLAALQTEGGRLNGLAAEFFGSAKTIIDTPWGMIAGQDFLFPETRGERPPNFEQSAAFGAALVDLAAEAPDVHKLWQEVVHLLRPSSDFADPALVRRVNAVLAQPSRARSEMA